MNNVKRAALFLLVIFVQAATLPFSVGAFPNGQQGFVEPRRPPLTEEVLEDLLKGPTPSSAIVIEIQQRGILFDVDTEKLKRFSELRSLNKRDGPAQKSIEEALQDANALEVVRLRLFLFSYGGQCTVHPERFENVKYMLDSKIKLLPGLLNWDRDPRYKYLGDLSMETVGMNLLGLSSNQIESYWKSLHALQLLTGTCSGADDDLRMTSRVVLGQLRGRLSNNFVITGFKVKDDEYTGVRDIHSVLILFSLAQDAENRKLGSEIVVDYLGKALEIAKQIEPSKEVQILQEELDRMLKEKLTH